MANKPSKVSKASKPKWALVILDGASGIPLKEHGGRTSLEAAHTPHLDALAESGIVGLARNVPLGMEPSSNVACMSIVGYNPAHYPVGRGALELAALGVDLRDNQVAMRLNLTNVTPEGIMRSYSTDNIGNQDAHALANELKAALDNHIFTLYKGTGFRLYLVVTGHPEIMETDFEAAHDFTDLPVAEHLPQGPAAQLLIDYQEQAKQILALSPINARRIRQEKLPVTNVFAFWPGVRPAGMEDFATKYHKQAALNSGVDLLNGIAQLTGMRRYHFEGVTDGPDNNYAAQGEGALAMLAENDVVFIHVESPDAEGHDGNSDGKRKAIEAIDREIISRLRAYASDHASEHPLRIIALPDHATPLSTKRHSGDPVPFVAAGFGISPNGGKRLTEREAQGTGLLIDPGYLLLQSLLG